MPGSAPLPGFVRRGPGPGGAALFVGLANVFLVGFALDAGCSLLDEGVRAATGSGLLLGLRDAIALAVLWASVPVFLLTALSPQLPARLLVPLVAVAAWLGSGAAPLQLEIPSGVFGIAVAAIQGVAAACGFLWVRTRSGSGRWLLAPRPDVAALSGWRALGFGVGSIGLGVPVVCAYLLVAGLTWVQLATHGFLRFDVQGVSMGERSYERDGRRVDLVGMMHLGEKDAYASLYDSFRIPGTIVLQEGVTDRDKRLAQPLRYARAAKALGLTEQLPAERYYEHAWEGVDEEERWPHVQRADVDTAAFSPATIAVLSEAARIWQAGSLREAIEIWLDLSRRPADLGAFWDDVVVRRNAHLLAALDAALPEYHRVVVPWGALHLPAIEETLRARGYAPIAESSHRIVSWSTLVSRLLAGAKAGAEAGTPAG